MKQGFTLLELLMVIAIIGLLASIVLVSYPSATEKARIAKTLSWAGSVSHLLGDKAVGVWTFDNISGPTVYDDSGLGNNGTINKGGNGTGCDIVDGVVGKAMSFDGVDDYVDAGNNLSLSPPYTIESWVKPSANVQLSSKNLIDFGATPNAYPKFSPHFYSGNKPLIYLNGSNYKYGTSNLADNKWHHIVFIVTGTGINDIDNAKIYVDAKEETYYATSKSTTPISPTGGIHIGTGAYDGLVDDVRIFSEALTQAQIQQFYADGLKIHQNLAVNTELN